MVVETTGATIRAEEIGVTTKGAVTGVTTRVVVVEIGAATREVETLTTMVSTVIFQQSWTHFPISIVIISFICIMSTA